MYMPIYAHEVQYKQLYWVFLGLGRPHPPTKSAVTGTEIEMEKHSILQPPSFPLLPKTCCETPTMSSSLRAPGVSPTRKTLALAAPRGLLSLARLARELGPPHESEKNFKAYKDEWNHVTLNIVDDCIDIKAYRSRHYYKTAAIYKVFLCHHLIIARPQ